MDKPAKTRLGIPTQNPNWRTLSTFLTLVLVGFCKPKWPYGLSLGVLLRLRDARSSILFLFRAGHLLRTCTPRVCFMASYTR